MPASMPLSLDDDAQDVAFRGTTLMYKGHGVRIVLKDEHCHIFATDICRVLRYPKPYPRAERSQLRRSRYLARMFFMP